MTNSKISGGLAWRAAAAKPARPRLQKALLFADKNRQGTAMNVSSRRDRAKTYPGAQVSWEQEAPWLREPALVLATLAVLAAGLLAASLLPAGPFAPEPWRLFGGDAVWYADIAQHGYAWNPAIGAQFGQHQNVAFFPLFPMVEWAAARLTPLGLPAIGIIAGLLFGLWSNIAFHRLAQAVLPGAAAWRASLLFAVWPGVCFLVMGYPTGLINLCGIQALRTYLAGRKAPAALWCGVGTAAAPNLVFVAAAFWLLAAASWRRDGAKARDIPQLAGLAVLSVGGLMAFMLYQFVAFGDPFAFEKAQAAYNPEAPFWPHLLRLFNPVWYASPVVFFLDELQAALTGGLAATATGRQSLNVGFQWTFDLALILLTIRCMVAAAGRRLPAIVQLAGWTTMAGYLWFIGTAFINVADGVRMLSLTFPLFLVLGAVEGRPAKCLPAGFAALAVLEMALNAARYAIT
jgi:hypothetical protein